MRPRTVVWMVILSLVTCVPTAAQTISGSISGTVVDAQGAAVAGAKVTAKNVEQGTPTTTDTDSVGHFVFPQLPPAVYTLLVEAPGFKSFEERNVVLNANTNISVGNIKLEVGAVNQTVEVVAQAASRSMAAAIWLCSGLCQEPSRTAIIPSTPMRLATFTQTAPGATSRTSRLAASATPIMAPMAG